MDDIREQIKNALSEAGCFCGDCGFQPGERGCPDCVSHWNWCADRLIPIMEAAAETAVEYAVSIPGRVGVISSSGRAEAVGTVAHLRARHPDVYLVRRDVRYGAWTATT